MCLPCAPLFCRSFIVPVHQLPCSSRLSLSENSVPESLGLAFLFFFIMQKYVFDLSRFIIKPLKDWEEVERKVMEVHCRVVAVVEARFHFLASSLVPPPPYWLQLPVTFPADYCIAKLSPQKSNLNSILQPQLIGPICSCGTLRQCLPAQLHFVSIEISNNICWLAAPLGLWLWPPARLSTDIDKVQSANGSFKAEHLFTDSNAQ